MVYGEKVIEFLSIEGKGERALRPGGLALTREVLGHWPVEKSWLIADIGCGMGKSVHFIQKTIGCQCIGIDQSASMVSAARKAFPDQTFMLGSGEEIPLEAGQADAVILECSLSVMAIPHLVLQEVLRILKPGGYLGVTDVYLKSHRESSEPSAKAVMTEEQWLRLLRNTGFQEIYFTDKSPVWGSYIASMIWRYGTDIGCDPDLPWCSLRQKGLGYFMLTARSKGI